MRDVIDLADRPATELLEIEITPEMIEAGYEEYRGHWIGELHPILTGQPA